MVGRLLIGLVAVAGAVGCEARIQANGGGKQNHVTEAADGVRVFHDVQRGVTCWIARPSFVDGVGISCLPDTAFAGQAKEMP